MLSAVMASGQQTPVPVDEEPHHHVLFKNEFVIVIRATLQPGEISLYHTHSHDSADIEIVSSTTREQVLGNEEASPETSHAGDVSADSCDAPITHRVRNVGSRPMDIIHVEFLQRPTHPSSQAATGLAAENASARVYNWIIAPRANTPRHSHNRPYLIVAATPMRLKMTAADGQSRSEEVNTGDFHWIESRVRHTLENDGVAQGQIVEMELK